MGGGGGGGGGLNSLALREGAAILKFNFQGHHAE